MSPVGVAASDAVERPPVDPATEQVVPLRHWGRYVAAAITLALLGCFIAGLVVNKNVEAHTIGKYFFNRLVLRGVLLTLELAVISQAIGIVLGVLLAVMRQSPNPVLSGVSWFYIWFFRGTPLLVQLIIWGYFGALYSNLAIGIPFTDLVAAKTPTNKVLTAFVAAIVGLSLNEGAYMAEIVRGGLLAVDEGQTEAALSLGMTRPLLLRRVVLPQATRVIIPPTGNEFISMLKNTSLVSVIAVADLLSRTTDISNRTLAQIPLLFVASLWYLVMTSVLTVGQYYLERRYARGSTRALALTPIQRLRLARAAAQRSVR